MKKTSPNVSYIDRIRSLAHGSSISKGRHSNPQRQNSRSNNNGTSSIPPYSSNAMPGFSRSPSKSTASNVADNTPADQTASSPPPEADGEGPVINRTAYQKMNVYKRFWVTMKSIVFSSYVNILLLFVPVGIVAKFAGLSAGIIFGMNAIAIIPLAGLLSHATESVAKRLGDTVGALMNVTFGNAVELIIFIALQKNEIRIVQASLLGSILANLLLILGMAFLVGGLRYREQIYNSTVTQMSACLLSLAVMSLLLPTAFHASFNTENLENASTATLKVSRGTSVILLIVYVLYLVFQLKSHAYMYVSTPQHIIDEEAAHPGPVAEWLETSSDSDTSSSSDSDSDGSSGSNTTAKRFKRAIRGRRRRKSSSGSKDTAEGNEKVRTPSFVNGSPPISLINTGGFTEEPQSYGSPGDTIDGGHDADDEYMAKKRSRRGSVVSHIILSKRDKKKERKREEKRERKVKKDRKARRNGDDTLIVDGQASGSNENNSVGDPSAPRRVDFAVVDPQPALVQTASEAAKRPSPFNLRHISNFTPPVFQAPTPTGSPAPAAPTPRGSIPRVKYGIRRTNSLPDRLNSTPVRPADPAAHAQHSGTVISHAVTDIEEPEVDEEDISRTTAVILLLASTALVALCAEFLVDSINEVIATSPLSEAFVGLIILPIVGNAAEHVTAVSVAAKNKMDLAIGVSVGSSIQIALFVTPFVVLLGWAMDKEMSLYFTLFETVSLFVSAFIVNFLVLDGRSNYLEGALLCCAYIIIAIAAFFYPAVEDSSNLGGNADAVTKMIRSLVGF
ncbi:Sodium/calcium exchanger protein-domain-containing protein [Calycina marina]|uniref:Sodium/calcium exchanger protein-domain-containing protein n=1 Tax=Calycina marina TaxID=1763456 RepID=A0A9P7ZBT6_9HELO|nr:Sodium/calcium exchanger protein-domain-containing protein [Calycina marina]